MECKGKGTQQESQHFACFNRDIVECKVEEMIRDLNGDICFNRDIVECKDPL